MEIKDHPGWRFKFVSSESLVRWLWPAETGQHKAAYSVLALPRLKYQEQRMSQRDNDGVYLSLFVVTGESNKQIFTIKTENELLGCSYWWLLLRKRKARSIWTHICGRWQRGWWSFAVAASTWLDWWWWKGLSRPRCSSLIPKVLDVFEVRALCIPTEFIQDGKLGN